MVTATSRAPWLLADPSMGTMIDRYMLASAVMADDAAAGALSQSAVVLPRMGEIPYCMAGWPFAGWWCRQPRARAMRTDMQLHTDVAEELRWDPSVSEKEIGIA